MKRQRRAPKPRRRPKKSQQKRGVARRSQARVVSVASVLNERRPLNLEEARLKGFENVVKEDDLAAAAESWERTHEKEAARIRAKNDPVPNRIYLIEKEIQESVKEDLRARLPPHDPRKRPTIKINGRAGYRQDTLRGSLNSYWAEGH